MQYYRSNGWHREIKRFVQNCCGYEGRAQSLTFPVVTAYPSPGSWQLTPHAFFRNLSGSCHVLWHVDQGSPPSKGLYLTSDLVLSCAHIQEQTYTHKSTDPHCHGAKRSSFKARVWERGPEDFGSTQTSQPEKFPGCSVVAHILSTWERDNSFTTSSIPSIPFTLFGVPSEGMGWGGMQGKERGNFFSVPQFMLKCLSLVC